MKKINLQIKNPTANILNGEKLKAFSQRTQGKDYLSLLLFNVVLEVFPNEIRHKKEIKDIQIGRKDIKLSSQITSFSMKK